MQLQQKLNEHKQKFIASGRVTPEMLGIMQRSTEDLRATGIAQRIPKVGQKAPSFELTNQDGKKISSSALLATGPLVLSFFRGVW
jgi:hypothetical protein